MTDNTLTTTQTIFDFSKLFIATKNFIDSYNQSETELTSKLNANHRATAEMITRLYAKQLNRAIIMGDDLSKNEFGFRTYNCSMATSKGCTVRTIMNHKKRLKQAGFITEEINHGASGIELKINDNIFSFENFKKVADLNFKKSSTNLENTGDRKNFHPLVHVQQEQNNINSNVDNKERRLSTPSDNTTYGTSTPQEQHMNTGESKKSEIQKNGSCADFSAKTKNTGGSENAKSDETTKESLLVTSGQDNPGMELQKTAINSRNKGLISDSETPDMSFLLSLVQDFWFYAKNILYPDMILTDIENNQILNLIWSSVYKKFKVQGTVKDYKKYQKILERRIDMVANWLDRNPNRWIPVPEVYFNPNNDRNGFDKTYQWYIKQEALKAAVRNEIILQKIEKEWEDHNDGKGQFKNKSRLQLFEIQRKRIGKVNDEKLIREYQTLIHKYLQIKNNYDRKY